MKSLIVSLALFAGISFAAHAAEQPAAPVAELQLFAGYDPVTHTYSEKLYSTSADVLSAGYLISNYAACYKGEPADVLSLVQAMVDVYNTENPAAPLAHEAGFVTGEDGKLYLTMKFQWDGSIYTWPQVRRCLR
jgi:hypothetical protein